MSEIDLKEFVQARKRDAELLAWFRLIRLIKKTMPQMDMQFKEWNLSQGQFDLLAEVAVQEGTNQQSCADRLNVTKGNVAQHLKNLEERGLMRREKVGRNNQIYMTDKGWDLFGSIMTPHDEYVREVLSPLSKEEVKQLSSTLRKINRALK